MRTRLLVAAVGIPLLLVIIGFCPPVVWMAILCVLTALGVYEALWSTGFLLRKGAVAAAMCFSALGPVWVQLGCSRFGLLLGIFLFALFLFAEGLYSHRVTGLGQMGGAFFLALMISGGFSALLWLRLQPAGILLTLVPLGTAFLSDGFALFAGMLFGKRKLAPELSPKKTKEGAAGGLVGGVVIMLLFGLLAFTGLHMRVDWLALAVYGLLGSVVSQLGDLSFSFIKRQYGIKDYGRLFPGHGGVLDRFDSVIFCAPLFAFLTVLYPAFLV